MVFYHVLRPQEPAARCSMPSHAILQPVSFQKQLSLQMTSDLNQDLRKAAPFNQSIARVLGCTCLLAKNRRSPLNEMAPPRRSPTCELLTGAWPARFGNRGVGSSRGSPALPLVTTGS